MITDARFPTLAAALDPDSVAEVLQQALPECRLDLDSICLSSPLRDVGLFLSLGKVQGSKSVAEEAFLEGYCPQRWDPESERCARIYQAYFLYLKALNPFQIQSPNWGERIDSRLREVARLLRQAQRSSFAT